MYKMNDNFSISDLEDGSFLVYDEYGNVHSLNSTAGIILSMINKKKDILEICSHFETNFNINSNIDLKKIVDNTIQQFCDKGIILLSEV